jgi:hypothetical protein
LNDLAPGDYTLQLTNAETQEANGGRPARIHPIHIAGGGVVEMNLVLIPENVH